MISGTFPSTSRQPVPSSAAGGRIIHRLLARWHRIPDGFVLNGGEPAPEVPADAGLAAELLGRARAMQAEAIDAAGRRVAYSALRSSAAYEAYRRAAAALRQFDPARLSDTAERLAFWINLYNALVIDAVIQFGVQRSVTRSPGFFLRAAYQVGGMRFSADDIEHGLLRANAAHPALPGRHFGAADPRQRLAMPTLDPRVHFALVCGARSCPPIAFYDPERIDQQLDTAAHSFLATGGARLDLEASVLWLSRIFQWYAPDFGARPLAMGDRAPLRRFAIRYLPEESRAALAGRAQTPPVRFLAYDWTLNA
jgi:hypothetical protein